MHYSMNPMNENLVFWEFGKARLSAIPYLNQYQHSRQIVFAMNRKFDISIENERKMAWREL